MLNLKSFVTGLFLGLSTLVAAAPAQAIPTVFNFTGSGSSSSISGSFTVDITGSGIQKLITDISFTALPGPVVFDDANDSVTPGSSFFDAVDVADQSFFLSIVDSATSIELVLTASDPVGGVFDNGTYSLFTTRIPETGSFTATPQSSVSVSEPGTLALAALGMIGLAATRQRRRIPR